MPRGLEDPENAGKPAEPEAKTEVVEVKDAAPPKEREGVTKTSDPEVHWTVPNNTRKVTLFQYDKNGKYLKQFAISTYISMRPGETFVIKAK